MKLTTRAMVGFVASAAVFGACASNGETVADDSPTSTTTAAFDSTSAEDTASSPSTSPTDTTETPDSGTITTQPGEDEPPLADTIEPIGHVEGGNVDNSYVNNSYPAELQGLIQPMITDLATRVGTPEAEIRVVSVEEVVWSDASLGCPQPGMAYAQVLTDGMRVILAVGNELYDYRSGGSGGFILCEKAPLKKADTGVPGTFEITADGDIVYTPAPAPTTTTAPKKDADEEEPPSDDSTSSTTEPVTSTTVASKDDLPTEGHNPPDV